MFGIDSPELLVIAVVALVVIGPKELPGLLRTWGKWMSQMRGMASEFRGHVDEMIRQSELDQVKKQLEDSAGGLDFKSLDPTKQIRDTIQEGMDEGQKALAEAKSSLDNPLAEPESAPQIAAEPAAATAAIEPPPAAPEALAEIVSPAGPAAPAVEPAMADSQAPHAPHDDKPKAAAAG